MKQVINSQSKERIGFLSSLDEILDVGKRFLFEPFVHKHNFIVFRDSAGNFGVCSPRDHEIVEAEI